jgi:hypothetical protein
MMKLFLLTLAFFMSLGLFARNNDEIISDSIVTNSFWDNWYGQVSTDMILLFPKGHAVKDVFPNGKSLGVSLAVGKWFSPEFGGRIKVNWNNGIIRDNSNVWYQPYGVKGGSYHDGGFLTINGDIQLNLHNLLGEYKPDRKWNIIIAPHAGAWFNLGSHGGPLMGVGIINTYRINDKWKLFADLGYSFVASVNGVASGTDHGGNSYAEINVGVEMSLSKNNSFHKTSNKSFRYKNATVINSFWDNWFIQAGLGMSLLNPYNTDLKNVFPNGSTYGLNVGLGKWFTPEAGVRVGTNWQNGIITNNHASYLASKDNPEGKLDKRGFLSLYADLFLNLHHIIGGYQFDKRWNAIVYPRAGLACNVTSSYAECPILGIGTEQIFAINERLKIYADISYQATTGGFLDAKFDNSKLWDCSNGWFDINVGVQYELGQTIGWDKPGEKQYSVKTVSGHNWPRFIVNTGASVILAFGAKTVLKKVVNEERPDYSDNKSFPSGHAAMAFAAARSIDKEFRKDCIWIPIVGYAAATAIGVERVVNDKHHWYDVAAGAAIGIGSAELTWWLSDLIFAKHNKCFAIGSSGNTLDVAVNF